MFRVSRIFTLNLALALGAIMAGEPAWAGGAFGSQLAQADPPKEAPVPAPPKPAAPADPAAQPEGELEAKVVAATGNIQVRLAEDQPWQAVKVGMILDKGAEIRTGLRSAVQLKIEPGHTVTIDRISVVKLLTLVKEKGIIRTNVGMKYGRTEYQIEVGGGDHDARVSAPSAVLGLRGSQVIFNDDALGAYATGEGKLTFFNNERRSLIAFGTDSGKASVNDERPNAASVAVAKSSLDPLGAFIARTLAEGAQVEAHPGTGGSDYQAVIDLQRLAKTIVGTGFGVPELPGPLSFFLVWSAGGAADLNLSVTDPIGNTVSFSNPVAGTFPTQGQFGTPDDGASGFGFEEVQFQPFITRGTYTIRIDHVGGADASPFVSVHQGPNSVPLTVSPNLPGTITSGQTVIATVNAN